MRHRALLIGVLLPAALSHAFYGALVQRRHRERHFVGFSYDVRPPRPPHAPGVPHGPRPRRALRMNRMRTGLCELRDVRMLSAPASGGVLAVEGSMGELDMEAVEGLDHVEVEATLCASSPEALAQLGATLEQDGDRLRLATVELDPRRSSAYGRVDLTVRVPLGMQATIAEPRLRP